MWQGLCDSDFIPHHHLFPNKLPTKNIQLTRSSHWDWKIVLEFLVQSLLFPIPLSVLGAITTTCKHERPRINHGDRHLFWYHCISESILEIIRKIKYYFINLVKAVFLLSNAKFNPIWHNYSHHFCFKIENSHTIKYTILKHAI